MLQTREPGVFGKIKRGETVDEADLSDEALRAVSQIIYARDTARDVDVVVPQQQLTREMSEFNVAYIRRLPLVRFDELQGIIRTVVPRMALMDVDVARAVEPNCLPPNVQIMIFKYLDKHLPDEVKAEIQTAKEVEEEGEEEIAFFGGDMEDADQGMGMDEDEDEDGHEEEIGDGQVEIASEATSETSEEL